MKLIEILVIFLFEEKMSFLSFFLNKLNVLNAFILDVVKYSILEFLDISVTEILVSEFLLGVCERYRTKEVFGR